MKPKGLRRLLVSRDLLSVIFTQGLQFGSTTAPPDMEVVAVHHDNSPCVTFYVRSEQFEPAEGEPPVIEITYTRTNEGG